MNERAQSLERGLFGAAPPSEENKYFPRPCIIRKLKSLEEGFHFLSGGSCSDCLSTLGNILILASLFLHAFSNIFAVVDRRNWCFSESFISLKQLLLELGFDHYF